MKIEKGKTSNGYAKRELFFNSRFLGRGGYCAFMGNNIVNMIIAKL